MRLLHEDRAREYSFDLNRTKIIATIGPASHSQAIIKKLLLAGVTGFRMNFSHDQHVGHKQRIDWIRQASRMHDRPVSIIADLQGPKMRVGHLPNELKLKVGEIISLAPISSYRATGIIPTQHDLSKKVRPGHRIMLNDGRVRTVVRTIKGSMITAEVTGAGILSSNKSLNLPDTDMAGEVITEKDFQDIEFSIAAGVDYIALSFVQAAADIDGLRQRLKKSKSAAKIVAKIETESAVKNLEEIVKASDAVMVARGDLAVEVSPEAVPLVQREVTRLCMQHGKISIVATQMLASMTDSLEPTRAEVSDVATAVITGVDCLMLSEETAVGNFPTEAATMMARIIGYTERNLALRPDYPKPEEASRQSSISSAVMTLTHQVQAKAIVAETSSGGIARALAAQRPTIPIMMISPDRQVAQHLAIVYGGIVFHHSGKAYSGERATSWLQQRGVLKRGDIVVVVSGKKGVIGGSDTIRVRIV